MHHQRSVRDRRSPLRFRNNDDEYQHPTKEEIAADPLASSEVPTRRRRKSFGGKNGSGSSRRTLSSEADAAKAKRDRRIEKAVESAVLRRAEREARETGTDAEDVARRLRRQLEEDARWKDMEEAKRRISRDRAKRVRMHSRAAHEATTNGGASSSMSVGDGEPRGSRYAGSSRSVATSTTYASTYRSSARTAGRAGASGGGEPALSGWLDKRKERKNATWSSTDRRSASAKLERRAASSSASAHRSSASIASNGSRRPKSALRTSSSASWTSLHRSSSRGSRGEHNYDDAGTVTSAVTFNTRDTPSISDQMRALNFRHRSSDNARSSGRSRNNSDDRSVRSSRSNRSHRSRDGGAGTNTTMRRREGTTASRSGRSSGDALDRTTHSASSLRSASSRRSASSLRSSARTDQSRRAGRRPSNDDFSVKSSRSNPSNHSLRESSTHSNGRRSQRQPSRSKQQCDEDNASVKSSKSLRSVLSRKKKKDGHESDNVSIKSSRSKASVSRSVRSLISKSSKNEKDKDEADDNKSVRFRNDVKITRHAHRARTDTTRNDSQDILRDQTGLEQEVVRLKLLIANARTEEEEERHHARRVANVNDRLRNLYEEQKNRAKRAKEDVDQLEKELERMRKLKAKVAPQVQQSRIKAWHNRRRPSNDGGGSRDPTPTRTRRSGGRHTSSFASGGNFIGESLRRNFASGASVSSWSVGNSIGGSFVSVQSLFERVERGLVAGLEQETVVTSETSGY